MTRARGTVIPSAVYKRIIAEQTCLDLSSHLPDPSVLVAFSYFDIFILFTHYAFSEETLIAIPGTCGVIIQLTEQLSHTQTTAYSKSRHTPEY